MVQQTGGSESRPKFELARITWPTLPSLPLAPMLFNVGARRLYKYSSTANLKMGTDEREGVMTALARSILGPIVPEVLGVITISNPPPERHGLLLARQPGTPLITLWSSLSSMQRGEVKGRLCDLMLRMRRCRFSYYGRPGGLPYTTKTECGVTQHTFCTTRAEWDESRIQALRAVAPTLGVDEPRRLALEQVQRETTCDDRPVLTHGDLSDRNILVDPDTLEVTGFIDWETANIMPAYTEYVLARLSNGHQSAWRRELLDVLKDVLRMEIQDKMAQGTTAEAVDRKEREQKYDRTLEAWNNLVNVERTAHEYGDDCSWTFEDSFQ